MNETGYRSNGSREKLRCTKMVTGGLFQGFDGPELSTSRPEILSSGI
jgi:hypothetical protein